MMFGFDADQRDSVPRATTCSSTPAKKLANLRDNGNEVVICDERGPWMGVVCGPRSMDCNTGKPWPTRMPYTGPCKAGWIHSRYMKLTVG